MPSLQSQAQVLEVEKSIVESRAELVALEQKIAQGRSELTDLQQRLQATKEEMDPPPPESQQAVKAEITSKRTEVGALQKLLQEKQVPAHAPVYSAQSCMPLRTYRVLCRIVYMYGTCTNGTPSPPRNPQPHSPKYFPLHPFLFFCPSGGRGRPNYTPHYNFCGPLCVHCYFELPVNILCAVLSYPNFRLLAPCCA